jgi:hypothetical protein
MQNLTFILKNKHKVHVQLGPVAVFHQVDGINNLMGLGQKFKYFDRNGYFYVYCNIGTFAGF